jgi:cytochrome bd-type quinol oxidase subunit 1
VLIFIAVTFTWLMGLMGYVRSGLRQHWHVYGVIRDNSADAFTPTLGFATQVVSVTVLFFFVLIGFVFWLSSLHDRADHRAHAPTPHPVPHTGGQTVLGGAQPSPVTEMRGLSAEDIKGRTRLS